MSNNGIDLRTLPGPAPYYVTVAMARSDYRAGRCAWPVSGDHTTRARASAGSPIENYIELARRKNT